MMKSYKKMADEVLEAVNEYNSKKVRRNIQLRIVTPAACCCFAAAVALGAWGSGLFNGIPSSELVAPKTDTETETETVTETETRGEFAFEFDPITEETSDELPAFTVDTSEEVLDTDICLPLTSESSDADIEPAFTDDTPYTEDITMGPPETSVIESGNPNSPIRIVENVHAPLDGYEFTLPITPKDTDIILALLNAFEVQYGSGEVINTTYELDIGLNVEVGQSNVRTYVPAEKGDEVYALEEGKVVFADYTPSLGYSVWVMNFEGTYIVYCHLNDCAVNEDDTVSKDQVVGYVGNTGMTTTDKVGYIKTNTAPTLYDSQEHTDEPYHETEQHHESGHRHGSEQHH